jgi:hypothetical protein
MNDFFTWELLATFAGATGAVSVLTQVVKKYLNIEPKFIALCLSFIILACVQFFYLKDFSANGIALAALNVLIVTGASIGLYEAALKTIAKKGE